MMRRIDDHSQTIQDYFSVSSQHVDKWSLSETVSICSYHTQRSAKFLNRPEYIGLLMRYVVDLTIILQTVFQLSLRDRSEGHMTLGEHVNLILYEFLLEKKTSIHSSIREFVETRRQFAQNSVVDKMNALVKENEVRCSHLCDNSANQLTSSRIPCYSADDEPHTT